MKPIVVKSLESDNGLHCIDVLRSEDEHFFSSNTVETLRTPVAGISAALKCRCHQIMSLPPLLKHVI